MDNEFSFWFEIFKFTDKIKELVENENLSDRQKSEISSAMNQFTKIVNEILKEED